MKMKLFALTVVLLPLIAVAADVVDTVKFDVPPKKLGRDIMQALSVRKSATSFSGRPVPINDIGNMLWAANGVNRPETGMRTAPSAHNKQDIDLYVFDQKNVYKYDANLHAIYLVEEGDRRSLFTERMKSPIIILLVSDLSKFNGGFGTLENYKLMGAMDAGIVSQNISLFCAAMGISTRVRASMDIPGIQKLLKLTDLQIPMLNHAVGYSK